MNFKIILNKIKPVVNRAAIFVINYNMPEESDGIYYYLKKNIKFPNDTYIIDNGSDLVHPAKKTKIYLKKNVQMTNGIMDGIKFLRYLPFKYYSYTFISTSTKFDNRSGDFISKANILFRNKERIVGYHPSLTKESRGAFKWMINKGNNKLRKASFLETVCVTYRADWFDSIGRFNRGLIYGWGIDLETGYIARKQNKKMYIDDAIQITKNGGIGYVKNRMGMSLSKRRKNATKNMNSVFRNKYGLGWKKKILKSVKPEELEGYREVS